MLKRTLHLAMFFLLAASFSYSQDEPRQYKRELLQNHPELKKLSYSQRIPKSKELLVEAKQALEARGFKVLGLAPKLFSPRKDSLEADKEVIRINVSFNLNSSGIKPTYVNAATHGSSVQAATDTIMTDGFEGDFPGTKWQRSGDPTWGKTNYQKNSGSYSVWCAKDSTNGVTPPQTYPNRCRSMMIYGPFDLSNINYAQLKFWYWLDTEYEKDWFYYMASIDGNNFQGIGVSGETSGWEKEMLHLSNVPGLGNVTGRSQIWIALLFESDANSKSGKGVFLDDVILTKRQVAGTPLAGALSGTLTPVGNPFIAVGDAGVAKQDSLKIDPGVQIRFEQGNEFIVLGSLNAIGTPVDSIVFTSNNENPKPNDWKGISYYYNATTQLKYSRIEFAATAIFSSNVPNNVISVISNSLMWKNGTGVNVPSGHITLSDDTISDNKGSGFYSLIGSAIIKDTRISNNSGAGINSGGDLRLMNSVIENNENGGISFSGMYGGDAVLEGNFIKGNRGEGVRVLTIYEVDFINNIIIENEYGIAIIERWNAFQGCIMNNCFIENGIGIDLRLKGDWCGPIINNIFYKDSVGIEFGRLSENQYVFCNDFHENIINFADHVNASLGVLVAQNAKGDSCDKYFNIFLDPLFVNPGARDYHLSYIENGFLNDSPCRDAGPNNSFYNDAVDGTRNDMGAYGGSFLSPVLTAFLTEDELSSATLVPVCVSFKFEDLPVNFSKTTVLKIKNDQTDTFTIKNLRMSDNINFSILKVESMILLPFGDSELTIEFNPKSIGSFSADLIIESDAFYGSDSAAIGFQGESFQGTGVRGVVSGKWTKANNPYIIYDDVFASHLTIEPGVKILFDGIQGFYVKGNFFAVGSKEYPIIFTKYKSNQGLGGIIIDTENDSVFFKYCTIEYLQGIGYLRNKTIISNCLIKNCSSYDSPVRILHAASPIIANNMIIDNNVSGYTGGGIFISPDTPPSTRGTPLIINNIIARNRTMRGGGGIYCGGASPKIVNNVIYANIAEWHGGGIILVGSSSPVITNNIIWNNISPDSSQIFLYGDATITVTYSDIQGGWQGEGNINFDPLFVDPTNGDYYLQPNSPCLDKGNPDPQYSDPEDPNNPGYALYPALGTARNDMGAYGGPGVVGWIVSANQPPSTFSLIAPANGDTVFTTNPVLSWKAATDPDLGDKISYTLYYALDAGFANAVAVPNISVTSCPLTNLQDHRSYYWKVGARDNKGTGTFSEAYHFFTLAAPMSFRLIAPANDDTVGTHSLVFSWSPALDPNPVDTIRYCLYYDTTKVFTQPVAVSGISDTSFVHSDSLSNNTRYFWTVVAMDKDSLVTASPDTFAFWVHYLPVGVDNFGRPVLPTEYALGQNYPNPFNPVTTIKYQLPEPSEVTLKVYSTLGQVIRTLVVERQMPGYYSIYWDGTDDRGCVVASGVYFYRIKTENFIKIGKALFLR